MEMEWVGFGSNLDGGEGNEKIKAILSNSTLSNLGICAISHRHKDITRRSEFFFIVTGGKMTGLGYQSKLCCCLF